MSTTPQRPTAALWCPHHHEPATHGCRGCAGDHAAGEHADAPVAHCRRCNPPPAKPRRRPAPQRPDVAALAAHDDLNLF